MKSSSPVTFEVDMTDYDRRTGYLIQEMERCRLEKKFGGSIPIRILRDLGGKEVHISLPQHTFEPTWIVRCSSVSSSEFQMLSVKGCEMQVEMDFVERDNTASRILEYI